MTVFAFQSVARPGATTTKQSRFRPASSARAHRAHGFSGAAGIDRRSALYVTLVSTLLGAPAGADVSVEKVTVKPELAPDQRTYDASDPKLRSAAQLLQDALAAPTVEKEEALWTRIIDEYGKEDGAWVPDIVGRAYGNRGNARARQGKLNAALQDYKTAIDTCPWSVDPLLNRGAVLEQLGRFKEAEDDYLSIIDVAPNDPAAWNNLGNTNIGMGNYNDAVRYFSKAEALSPKFSFASANRVVAMFAAGDKNGSMREMRSILRRYPDLPDTRAALTAALWSVGKEGEAETQWQRVSDPRYRDPKWLKDDRRWPPALVDALTAFQQVKTIG